MTSWSEEDRKRIGEQSRARWAALTPEQRADNKAKRVAALKAAFARKRREAAKLKREADEALQAKHDAKITRQAEKRTQQALARAAQERAELTEAARSREEQARLKWAQTEAVKQVEVPVFQTVTVRRMTKPQRWAMGCLASSTVGLGIYVLVHLRVLV